MKRSTLAACLALMVVAGCNDSKNPVSPGDLNDPSLGIFLSQYQGLVEFSGLQIQVPVLLVNTIYSTPTAPGLAIEQDGYTLSYNASTKFWIYTEAFCDYSGSDSTCFAFRDSLQLLQLGVASQYPDSLTSIRSFLSVDVSGTDVDYATSDQHLNYTLLVADPFKLDIDGTGGLTAGLYESDTDSAGITDCHTVLNHTVDVNHLILDESDSNCPTGGKLTHSGPTTITCLGGHEGSISGNWSATEDYLLQKLIVVGAGKRWEDTLDCHLFDFTFSGNPPVEPLGFPRVTAGPLSTQAARWGATWRAAIGR